jgi:hypothetical protein
MGCCCCWRVLLLLTLLLLALLLPALLLPLLVLLLLVLDTPRYVSGSGGTGDLPRMKLCWRCAVHARLAIMSVCMDELVTSCCTVRLCHWLLGVSTCRA